MSFRIAEVYQYGGIKEVIRKISFRIRRSIFQYCIYIRVKVLRFRFGLNKEERKRKIIVSLTSYPQRFHTLEICLKSLLLQKMKPDKIIVWYDCDDSRITSGMRKMEMFGVSFRHVEINLRSHEKYFYAMQEYKDDIIITVDDDIVYPATLVKSLVSMHNKYPECVCARRVHKIVYNSDGSMKPYNSWIDCCHSEREPSDSVMATGCGGVLYPPYLFTDNSMFDAYKIKKYCLEADDIWLYCFEKKLGIRVVWVPCIVEAGYFIKKAQRTGLMKTNVTECKNDYYINQVLKYLDYSELTDRNR